MTATVKLPRMLGDSVKSGLTHEVEGATLSDALAALFLEEPGLRNHLLDEKGAIRQHVLIFVDGSQAELETHVGERARILVLHSVSGGSL